jgi:hypothetical protein
MQQIADWLNRLGMSEYAQRFADNDIDASVLPELTDQDLKDLGISLGHRRKMLRAIRDLGNVSVASTARTIALHGSHQVNVPIIPIRPPWRPSQLGKTPLNAASSPSCSRTSSARLRSRPSSTPRTCAF